MNWNTDIAAAKNHNGGFFIGLWVWHGGLQEWSWDTEYVWIDEGTGDIDVSCGAGWDLDDYEAWLPIKLPAPPSPMPANTPSVSTVTG